MSTHEHMCLKKPEQLLDPLELEFQEVMVCLRWLVGTELRSFTKAVCALNY